MITEDYVSFETAKLLEEKGFDGNTFYKYADKEGVIEEWYDDYRERMVRFDWDYGTLITPPAEPQDKYRVYGVTIPAPSLALAMKWLRKNHQIFIRPNIIFLYPIRYYCEIFCYGDNLKTQQDVKTENFESPEEACEAAIKYCLENLI